MLNQLILKISIIIICFSGCIIQINEVTTRYFKYKTKTTLSVTVPSDIILPMLSTCWRLSDIIDFNAVERNMNIKLGRWYDPNFSFVNFYNGTRNFTVSDWFKYSPNVEEILDIERGCFIRLPDEYSVRELPRIKCFELFNITKYIYTEHICYQFDPIITDMIKVHQYTMTPAWPGFLYGFAFNPKYFNSIGKVVSAIHLNDSSYMFDYVFAPTILRTSLDRRLTVEVTYREFNRLKKGSPYEPICDPKSDKFGSEYERRFAIFNELLKVRNHVSPFVKTYEPLDIHYPTYNDFKNATFLNMFTDILGKVERIDPSCKFKSFKTDSVAHDHERMRVKVNWPVSETFSVKYIPDQDFIDFIVYICSCIGIWFGLSFYSFHDGIVELYSFALKHIRSNPIAIAPENQSIDEKLRKCNIEHEKYNQDFRIIKISLSQVVRLVNDNIRKQNHRIDTLQNETEQLSQFLKE